MTKKNWWQEHHKSTSEGGGMDEKEVRLDEVQKLKEHLDGHGVALDNPDHTVRVFVRKRIEEIERLFGKKEEAPAEEPAPGEDQSIPPEETVGA